MQTLRHRRAAALTVSLAVAGVLAGTVLPAQAHSGHHGNRPTCRGQGVDRDALIRYETDIVIDASLNTIWKLQTDVERWPSWQSPVLTSERVGHGPFRKGTQWVWTTPVPATPTTPATTLDITSTVQQVKNKKCLLWSGPAVGEGLRIDRGVHLWTFQKVKGGVRVHTEETWTGDQVEADIPTATEHLGMGLEAWLRELKAAAEARD
ncbi:SRPBCC family protein [Streptomyces sp. NPDC091377]|uniref:SRPBCC family protein n=1 Tax=unclassified Streptomyces TaxID=2593676 RepID=UPI003816CECF